MPCEHCAHHAGNNLILLIRRLHKHLNITYLYQQLTQPSTTGLDKLIDIRYFMCYCCTRYATYLHVTKTSFDAHLLCVYGNICKFGGSACLLRIFLRNCVISLPWVLRIIKNSSTFASPKKTWFLG